MADRKYEWTKEQEEAIGQLVVDHWGDDMQTGWENGASYIYFKSGPSMPVKRYNIHPDGTVMREY